VGVVWKVLVGLLLTAPVAAYVAGVMVGPPVIPVHRDQVAAPAGPPTTKAPRVQRADRPTDARPLATRAAETRGVTSSAAQPSDSQTSDAPTVHPTPQSTPDPTPRPTRGVGPEQPVPSPPGSPVHDGTATPGPGDDDATDQPTPETPDETTTEEPDEDPSQGSSEGPSDDSSTESPDSSPSAGDRAPESV
jgi:hypothetical protein